jgi:hypothetical protein
MLRFPSRSLLAACLALAVLPVARATTLARLDAAQVDALAHRIVEARCVEVRPAKVPGLATPAIAYLFEIERVIKGDELAARVAKGDCELVVRQLGDAPGSGSFTVLGLPAYQPGARYRLALNGESRLGLTSPVGFGQGVVLLSPAPVKP